MKLTRKQWGIIVGVVVVLFVLGRSCSRTGSTGTEQAVYAEAEAGPLLGLLGYERLAPDAAVTWLRRLRYDFGEMRGFLRKKWRMRKRRN